MRVLRLLCTALVAIWWLTAVHAADAGADGVITAAEGQSLPDGESSSAGPRLPPTRANVAYGPHARHVLDLYQAESATPTPVLICFHGGGYVRGNKAAYAGTRLMRQCLEAGISVVSANYRFVQAPDGGPGDPFPAPMLDGARVVQFVRTQAAEWHLDPARIALTGGSAGAAISLWIALHDDLANLDSADPVERQSTRVSGVLSSNGQTTLDPRVILARIGGSSALRPNIRAFYGIAGPEEMERPDVRKLIDEASALNHVSADDPPVYLLYGGKLAGTPLPPNAGSGIVIHHPMFGKLLQDRYRELGIECHLACQDVRASLSPFDFLRRRLGVGKGPAAP